MSIERVDVFDGDERPCRCRKDLRQPCELQRNTHGASFATACSTGDAALGPRACFFSRPGDAVSVATTCARTCVACSSCASWATLRGRDSSTGIGRAERRGRSGHDRHDAIGQQDRFLDAVGDHDGRHPSIRSRSEPGQFLLKRLARERVERAERVVQEEHLRLGRDRARDRDALAHPTRKLSRPTVDRVAEADVAECVAAPASPAARASDPGRRLRQPAARSRAP